jgi:hypothetical protein
MAQYNGRESGFTVGSDSSIGALVKQLGRDLETLLRQEVALAKAEVAQTGRRLARDVAAISLAAMVAFLGVAGLTAGLIILLGRGLGGRYWLAAMLVGGAMLATGYAMFRTARADLGNTTILPKETLATLREDKQWAAHEAREMKHDLTTTRAQSVTRG